MLPELRFTEARGRFSAIFDNVWSLLQPTVVVRRRKHEDILMLRRDLQQNIILSAYRFPVKITRESDKSYTLTIDALELWANAETLEAAVAQLVADLKEYALSYANNAQLYLNSPNRRQHFPYVLRILMCDSDKEIEHLLELENAS
ncbi:MAG TPA: exoribonuclease R [Firmicutes bacterium]|nr:exoribonuclease R [Bacillota bacterium]HHY98850.1 exoribonuclease R [Bacillota bacterium]